MALTTDQIDTMYEEVLARHATTAEKQAFAALSLTEPTAQIEADIATLPEATTLVDPLVRLYQGAFGRMPDSVDPDGTLANGNQSGFGVNVSALRSGVTLLGMAQAFVASAEFHSVYGTTEVTTALITAFYEHILGRDPSSDEVKAWQDTHLDAAHILLGFTQSTEFIARSQASVDAFKIALANGEHPNGPLPPPPPELTLTSDHDIGGVNEGSTVTFTLQGPASHAGQTFNYNISGVSAADIVGGQMSGSVTLDAQGLAIVTRTLVADATTEGPETLTLSFGALSDSITVNDTSTTPVVHNFTAVVGETLNGSDAQDTFIGVVDRTFVNDQTTLSNLVDIANGGGGFDTEKVFVLNNFFGTEITPTANSIEIFQVTDTPGSNFDMRFVPNVLEIDEVNSDGSTVFNNVQNLVSIGLISPDANGVDMTVNVADTVANGDIGVTLVNAGPNGSAVDITYKHQGGADAVTGYTFNVTGQNQNVDLNNTTPTKFINVVGSDTTAFLNLDLQDGSAGLAALTSIDAHTFAGALTMDDIGVASAIQNDLTVLGAQGNNIFAIKDANNAAINVTTFGGADKVTVTNQGTGKVTVSTGDGNGDTVVVNNGAGASGDVKVTVGNGNADKVTVTTSNNVGPTAALVDIAMGTGTADVANITLGSFHTLTVNAAGLAANISQTQFVGITNASQTITADGGDATITSFSGAKSPITIHATGTGVNQVQSAVNGGDSLGHTYNQVIWAETADNTGTSAVKVTTGAGADFVDVFGGSAGTNNMTVDTGAGNDFVYLVNQDLGLHAGVSLAGGAGTDTLELTALAAHGGLNGATVTGFEALEIQNSLGTFANGGVVVSDFGVGGGGLTHVILDAGFTTGADLVGVTSGTLIDLFGSSAGQTLTVEVTGANIHTNDVLSVDLHNAANVAQNFGNIQAFDIENVNITSDGAGTATNTLTLSNVFGLQNITTLTIDGDNALNLSGAFGGLNNVTTVNAGSHTGGLTLNLGGDNQDISITTGSGKDVITGLGTGDHHIDTGAGDDTITTGGGSTTVHAGLGADTINSQGLIVNNVYQAANESVFGGASDTINAFSVANDKIDISAIVNGGQFDFAGNFTTAGANSAINGDIAGHVTAVFNATTHDLWIDVNGDHVLNASDMQIHLTGIAAITAGNFIA